MLGWCPNVSITRAREDELFDDTIVNAPEMPQKNEKYAQPKKIYSLCDTIN